jgi:hypothetical protein
LVRLYENREFSKLRRTKVRACSGAALCCSKQVLRGTSYRAHEVRAFSFPLRTGNHMKRALVTVTFLLCISCVGLYLQRNAINDQDTTIVRLNSEILSWKQLDEGSDKLIAGLRSETNRLAKELQNERALVSQPHSTGLSEEEINKILGPTPEPQRHYIPPQQDVAQVLHNAEMLGELRRIREAQEQQNWNQQFWNLERAAPQPYDFDEERQASALERIAVGLEQQRFDNGVHRN